MRSIMIGAVASVLGLYTLRALPAQEVTLEDPQCGNVNGDAILDLSDPLYLLNYLFLNGPAPTCVGPTIDPQAGSCSRSADLVAQSCQYGALADFKLTSARCLNLESPEEIEECVSAAREEYDETLSLCEDQLAARRELCEALGEEPYVPTIDPANFTEEIDNPFFPLVPGTTFVYEKETEEGTEHTVTTVTHEKRMILGVPCTVVQQTETIDGELVEDTSDWFAQDVQGNVWYFGETSIEFEEGDVIGLEGSWDADDDDAQPGIVVPAASNSGSLNRQEYLLGEAEDMGTVLSLDAAVDVAHGAFEGCLQIEEFSPIEPEALEQKFYATGVGLVLELDIATGERMELIDVFSEDEPGQFEEVGLRINFNSTDDEAQIEINVEGEDALEQVQFFGPDGQLRIELDCNDLTEIGQSGFCLESVEPSLGEVLEAYPEGVYRVRGRTVEGEVLEGETNVSHDLLEAPVITFPVNGATSVEPDVATGTWLPIEGAVAYRVELEDEETGISLGVDLPAEATSFTFPAEWLTSGTQYVFELEAISENGNRTESDLSFRIAN